ncbi:IS110 family transposase, partial [Thalassotalea litorea]
MNHTIIAIDIAKSSFHVVSMKHNKVRTDRAFTRQKLKEWLAKQPASLVVIEACGSAHYWARYAQSLGHQAKLIAPKHVKAFRQGHKTDQNDALAIATASLQPKVKSVAVKTVEQQGLQSIDRISQHLSDNQTAVSNMLRGLLAEFGIIIPKGISAFKERIPEILEDGENGLPDPLRHQIAAMFYSYLD